MHTHSGYSPDSRTSLPAQARRAREAGLDVLCATDHDTVDGALRLRELADGFRVIVGEEVSSADGEIIGLFLERTVPRGLSGEETIARIREQGGIVSIPHPFSRNRRHRIRRAALERLWPLVDCIEVFNAREAFTGDNQRAAAFALEHGLPGAAGSDAHRPGELGRAFVEVDDFAGPAAFVASLRSAVVHGRLAGYGVHVLTRYDRLRKWLGERGAPGA
jgi:predicted metal-dependent phosphoesterase TrpH